MRISSRSGLTRWLTFAVLTLLAWAPVSAQLQTGDVYGRVTDEQGQPLPGVTVTLSGIGAPRTQISDDSGLFRFLGLFPGSYALKAELEGFSGVEQSTVEVRVGGKREVALTLSAAIQENITVTDTRPLVDERQANKGASLSAVDLDKVPTARDPWSLLSQAPGVAVDRVNLGGNESGQQSVFLGNGSGTTDNTFAVDGVIMTDMAAVGASLQYYDFGAFEEVQITTSSTDVSIATSGVTINQVTKRGTNELRGSARYLYTDGSTQSDPQPLGDGLFGNAIDKVEEYGLDVGGPIVKDRLWAWGSWGESDIFNIVVGGQLDRTKLEDTNVKLNAQITPAWSGVLHYWDADKLKFGRGAGPDRAPGTTWNQTTPSTNNKVETSVVAGSDMFFNILASKNEGEFTLTPLGGRGVQRYTDADGVMQNTNLDFAQEGEVEQFRADGSYFATLGGSNHELKFGIGTRSQSNDSVTVWPQGRFVNDLGAGVDRMVVFPRDRAISYEGTWDSAWLQDTMTFDRLTISAGVRYDKQEGKNNPVSAPANPFTDLLPALNFEGNDADGLNWDTVVPRVGATYALGEKRSTLVRGSFSRYAQQLGLNYVGRVNPLGYQYAYFYFTDANDNFIFDPGEAPSLVYGYVYNINVTNPSSTTPANHNASDLSPSLTDELTFTLEHALSANLAGTVTLTGRKVHDIPEVRTLVVDDATGNVRVARRADWEVTQTVVDELPNGQNSSPRLVYNLRDGVSPTGGGLLINGDREQNYFGIALGLNRRLSNHWSARGYVAWNDWTWDIPASFREFDDPTDTLRDPLGFPDGDGDPYYEQSGGSGNKTDVLVGANWTYNFNMLYEVASDRPWGFNVGASIDGRQGYVSPPYRRVGGPLGARQLQLTDDVEDFRNDDVRVLNLHVDKEVDFGAASVTFAIDGFNVTDEDPILQIERRTNIGRTFATDEVLSPRVFRFGATFRFK
jgi:hypothetical protein